MKFFFLLLICLIFSLLIIRLSSRLYLPYAEWLVRRGRFEEAQAAFRSAGRASQARRLLQHLSANAVNACRFDDASYFCRLLAGERLRKMGEWVKRGIINDDNKSINSSNTAHDKKEPWHDDDEEEIADRLDTPINVLARLRSEYFGLLQRSRLYYAYHGVYRAAHSGITATDMLSPINRALYVVSLLRLTANAVATSTSSAVKLINSIPTSPSTSSTSSPSLTSMSGPITSTSSHDSLTPVFRSSAASILSHPPPSVIPSGISFATCLFVIARYGLAVGAFRVARQAYSQLSSLILPLGWQREVELGHLTLLGKPFIDTDRTGLSCYRCNSTSPPLTSRNDRCSQCGHTYVRSAISQEVLPIIEFFIEDGITHEEAMTLISTEPSTLRAKSASASSTLSSSTSSDDVQTMTVGGGLTGSVGSSGGGVIDVSEFDTFSTQLLTPSDTGKLPPIVYVELHLL